MGFVDWNGLRPQLCYIPHTITQNRQQASENCTTGCLLTKPCLVGLCLQCSIHCLLSKHYVSRYSFAFRFLLRLRLIRVIPAQRASLHSGSAGSVCINIEELHVFSVSLVVANALHAKWLTYFRSSVVLLWYTPNYDDVGTSPRRGAPVDCSPLQYG